uniref:Uncharacterized protein n=1 Tax=Rhizophora mucronata TaxID=61149 RepID=A0A2P2IIG6_RHIMU
MQLKAISHRKGLYTIKDHEMLFMFSFVHWDQIFRSHITSNEIEKHKKKQSKQYTMN